MNNLELNKTNQKIELHNKFCFMKKTFPFYKKKVSLIVPLVYAVLSGLFLSLPQFLKIEPGIYPQNHNQEQNLKIVITLPININKNEEVKPLPF